MFEALRLDLLQLRAHATVLPKSPLGKAIDYSLGHEPYAYLKDLLERLPGMKSHEVERLLPSNWQPAKRTPEPVLATP